MYYLSTLFARFNDREAGGNGLGALVDVHCYGGVVDDAIGKGAEQFSGVQPNSNVGRIMKSFYEKK